MEDQTQKLTITQAGGGGNLGIAGNNYRVLVNGEQTGGAYAVIDMLVPDGGGPGPHSHAEIQESFYVVDGEVEFKTEALTYTAKKGDFVNIPLGGMVHCFKNKSGSLAHLICTVTPAGMEKMFEEIGKPIGPNEFLPPVPLDEEGMKNMKALGEKYGQQFYPPNYLD